LSNFRFEIQNSGTEIQNSGIKIQNDKIRFKFVQIQIFKNHLDKIQNSENFQILNLKFKILKFFKILN
jgi:hypothetical protein